MRFSIYIFAYLCAAFFLCRCKKEPAAAASINNSGSTSSWPTAADSIEHSRPCDAWLLNGINYTLTNNSLSFYWWGKAYFLQHPKPLSLVDTTVSIGGVSINGAGLPPYWNMYIPSVSYESTQPNYSPLSQVTWQVNSWGSIPTFTYAYPFPVTFTGYNNLPDTLISGQSNHIALSLLEGYDTAGLQLQSNVSNTVSLPRGTWGTTLPSTFMAGFQTGPATLTIYCTKSHFDTLSGKQLGFVSSFYLNKTVYIK